MAEPAPAPDAAPAPPPVAPWYEGKADTDTVGFLQNNGWDKDPVTAALAATKSYREAQKHIGVPPDRLIKLPKDAADEAGWKDVYGRLGVPPKSEDYDFSELKHADGSAISDAMRDTLRKAAHDGRVPKDRAMQFASQILKDMDGQRASEGAERLAKLQIEKTELAKNWGQQFEYNKLTAMQGARRLGVDPETVSKLEEHLGYSKVMEMFRKIGAATSEDTFVEGSKAGGMATTREGAAARLAELQNDKEWGRRLTSGDVATRREFDNLSQIIAA